MANNDPTAHDAASTSSTGQFWGFLRAPLEFGVHIFAGTLIFAIIAMPAIALDLSLHSLAALGISTVVMYGLKLAEWLLLLVDLVLFGVFLVRDAIRMGQKL